jgi:hypothetical protein
MFNYVCVAKIFQKMMLQDWKLWVFEDSMKPNPSHMHGLVGSMWAQTWFCFAPIFLLPWCCSLKILSIFFFFEANVMVILWLWFLKVHSFFVFEVVHVSIVLFLFNTWSWCSFKKISVINVFRLLIILVLVSW